VTHERDRHPRAEVPDHRDNVLRDLGDGVVVQALWLGRQVEAAQVRGVYAVAVLGQRSDSIAPAVPELRETMQQEDFLPSRGPAVT
jgi:hypothetical protein